MLDAAALVGRGAELAAVADALDAAAEGAGGVLLVTGEAGVGKSRLLAEAARLASSRGQYVLTGRATDGGAAYRPVADALLRGGAADLDPETAPDLAPYRAALGRLLPGWAADTDRSAEPQVDPVLVLGEGLVRLVGRLAGNRGTLLLLEDLHWADVDTMALLSYLAERLATLPLLVMASAREDEPGSPAALRLLAGTAARSLPLSRLGPDDMTTLAAARSAGRLDAATLAVVVGRADGLPLLAEELVDDAVRGAGTAGPVPRTLTDLVRGRLERLDAVAQRCLAVAAVAGTDPDWDLLPAVLGVTEDVAVDAARAAVTAGLLRADTSGMRWRHALTRDAVLATLLPPGRALLARRAAAALLDRGRRDDPVRAAELLSTAGDHEQAAGLFLTLARQDQAAGALRTAEELLDRAAATGAAAAAVAVQRVALLLTAGRVGEALDAGVAALSAAAGDEHAELCLRLARAAVLARRWADAEAFVARAGRPDDPRSSLLVADAAYGAGDLPRAGRLASAAVLAAERSGSPAVLCEALDAAGRVARVHDSAAARTAFARAAQVAAEHRLVPQRVAALIGLGTVELLDGERSPALLQARDLAAAHGLVGQASAADTILVDLVLADEGPRAAEATGRALLARGTQLHRPDVQAVGALTVALARAADGDPAGMEAALAQLPEGAPGPAAAAPAVRALLPLMAHDLAAASALLDAGITPLVAHPVSAPLHEFGMWALLRTAVDDRGQEARDALRSLPAARRPSNRGALRYADAIAAGRAGRPADAAALVEAGDANLAPGRWLHRLLRLVVLEAAVVDGWGDPVPLLRHDLAEFERAGEHQLARTCRDVLRRAGAATRRRGTTPVPPALRAAGVTSREVDVLDLVAEGLSNAEIAARLHLSPRTVETHVASLLAKLGATDRDQLRVRRAALTPEAP